MHETSGFGLKVAWVGWPFLLTDAWCLEAFMALVLSEQPLQLTSTWKSVRGLTCVWQGFRFQINVVRGVKLSLSCLESQMFQGPGKVAWTEEEVATWLRVFCAFEAWMR